VKNADTDGTELNRTWFLQRGDAFAAVHLARGPQRVLANPECWVPIVAETSACAPRRRRRSAREVGGSDGRNGGRVRRFTRDLLGCHWAPAVRALSRGAQALSHRSGVFVDPTEDRIGRK
jgi:hypothetical protein